MVRAMVVVGLCALTLAGCTPRAATTAAMPVSASLYPLFEFAQRIGGDRVSVRNLVPAGVESHDYEPTPQDLSALVAARVFIYNDAGFEPWLDKLLPQIPRTTVIVNATDGLPLHMGTGTQGEAADPHVWLDPVLAEEQAEKVLAGFVKADPAGAAVYQANARKLKEDLEALHRRFATVLRSCRQKEFITTHAAFGYLAGRYGLTQIPIGGLAPEADPSPRRLREVVQLAKARGINVIYYETLASPRVAEVIAREVGARVQVLNPIEGLTPEEVRQGKDYFTVMDENLRNLAEGLRCRQ